MIIIFLTEKLKENTCFCVYLSSLVSYKLKLNELNHNGYYTILIIQLKNSSRCKNHQ